MDKPKNFHELYRKYQFDNDDVGHVPALWHYTSADGLLGIVRNSPEEFGKMHFWFTRSDYLNDTSEGTHILDLFKDVCAELYNQEEISETFYDSIRNCEISSDQIIAFPVPPSGDVTFESRVDSAACHAYICSFSLKKDSLDMWRYYSKGNGGYGLKVNSYIFDKQQQYEYSAYDDQAIFYMIQPFKVIYSTHEKQKILRDVIVDTYDLFTRLAEDENPKIKDAKGFISGVLKVLRFRFKRECYASEQEYRFVLYRPDEKPKELVNELPKVQYRVQNGILVPYVDVEIDNAYHYLREVLISPYVEHTGAKDATKEYLLHCGFNCHVEKSTLPVRKE